MNSSLLKSQIILNNKKIPDVAKKLKISKSAFYRKLNGKSEFTRKEINEIIDFLQLDENMIIKIFFSN